MDRVWHVTDRFLEPRFAWRVKHENIAWAGADVADEASTFVDVSKLHLALKGDVNWWVTLIHAWCLQNELVCWARPNVKRKLNILRLVGSCHFGSMYLPACHPKPVELQSVIFKFAFQLWDAMRLE